LASSCKESACDKDTVELRNARNVIIDHCSISWGIDETISAVDCKNVTIQWSIISEGLREPRKNNGAGGLLHSEGGPHCGFRNAAESQQGDIIDSEVQKGGLSTLQGGTAPADSDNDGIPDSFERQRGLNPNNPADAALRAGGFSNLEVFLNEVANRTAQAPDVLG
jgi:hypothetical protein